MTEQGFESALGLGEVNDAPALLRRQSVVLGISDGRVMAKPPPTKPARLCATMPTLPQRLLDGFGDIPLRNDLPAGGTACSLSSNEQESLPSLVIGAFRHADQYCPCLPKSSLTGLDFDVSAYVAAVSKERHSSFFSMCEFVWLTWTRARGRTGLMVHC